MSTVISMVYSTVYSGADQRTPQRSASLTFVRAIYKRPVDSPHKGPATGKWFHLMMSSYVNELRGERWPTQDYKSLLKLTIVCGIISGKSGQYHSFCVWATSIARPLAAMILTMQYRQGLIFHEKRCAGPVQCQCWLNYIHCKYTLSFLRTTSHVEVYLYIQALQGRNMQDKVCA